MIPRFSEGLDIKCLYQVKTRRFGFLIKIKKAYFDYLKDKHKEHLATAMNFTNAFGNIGTDYKLVKDVVTVKIGLPFLKEDSDTTNAPYALAHENAGKISRRLSSLFYILNIGIEELTISNDPNKNKIFSDDFYFEGKSQFYIFNLVRYESGIGIIHPMDVHFFDKSLKFFLENKRHDFPEARKIANSFYVKFLYKDSKKRREFLRHSGDSFQAHIRDCGTPHFSVAGNCACLGASPDDFSDLLFLNSHNLDSSLQQISMLAAVVKMCEDLQGRQRLK